MFVDALPSSSEVALQEVEVGVVVQIAVSEAVEGLELMS
jgi:hypothetical protein